MHENNQILENILNMSIFSTYSSLKSFKNIRKKTAIKKIEF